MRELLGDLGEWLRAFTAHSFLACRPLRPRGVRHRYVPELRCQHRLRRMTTGSALPTVPQSVPRGRLISWLHWFASAAACQAARPPVRIRLERPAFGDFYFQAFDKSVSLPVAGYNYNRNWTPRWRDFHPLEWQLASLHGHARRTGGAHVSSAVHRTDSSARYCRCPRPSLKALPPTVAQSRGCNA